MTAPAARAGPAPAGWALRVAAAPLPAPAAIAEDAAMLRAVAEGGGAVARIWQSENCIASPARLARSDRFAAAARSMAEAGWPVILRGSGGDPVPLAPGMVNLSLAYWVPLARRWSIEDAYSHLSGVAAGALRSLGYAAEIGAVAGAFCPGRFDLGIAGRKVAGTAQQRRPAARNQAAGTAILAHLALSVEPDLAAAITALRQFERLVGRGPAWRRNRVASLACRREGDAAVLPAVLEQLRVSLTAGPVIG